MPKPRVFVDTCIIIEAFRVGCWKSVCAHYSVETVEACISEACTGDSLLPGRTPIDRAELTSRLGARHEATQLMLAQIAMDYADLPAIDDGELHLLAWLHAHRPLDASLLISTSDKAALRATHDLEWLDLVTSLEALAKTAGVERRRLDRLEEHFSERWMSTIRTKLRLGTL